MARIFSTTQTDFGIGVVIERASGFYWKPKGAIVEHGPFATPIDAISSMEDEDLQDFEADDNAQFGVAAACVEPNSDALTEGAILRLEEYN
jgi:hypothetical protein